VLFYAQIYLFARNHWVRPLIDLEEVRRLNELAELAKAVVSGIELRQTIRNIGTDLSEVTPAEFVCGLVDRAQKQGCEPFVILDVGRRRGTFPRFFVGGAVAFFLRFTDIRLQNFGVDELVAGGDEGFRCLSLTKAEDELAVLAETGSEPRKSESLETRQKPSRFSVYRRSIASIIMALSVEFLPVV